MRITKSLGQLLVAVLVAGGGISAVTAANFAKETLTGVWPANLDWAWQLERHRDSGAGSSVVSDTTVVQAENSVGHFFGVMDWQPVTYSHRMDWLGDVNILSAKLTITALSPTGSDLVTVNGSKLGYLNFDWSYPHSETEFAVDLWKGVLDVQVEKGLKWPPDDTIFLRLPDVNVWKSTLEVTYDVPSVPEPGTWLASLLLIAVGAMAGVRRRMLR